MANLENDSSIFYDEQFEAADVWVGSCSADDTEAQSLSAAEGRKKKKCCFTKISAQNVI